MRVSLQVKSGPLSGRRFDVRDGQIARFGATEWADFSFPDDPDMRDVHFMLHCTHSACVLRPATADATTLVNDEAAEEVVLRGGDEIVAGQTKFAVFVEGDEAGEAGPAPDSEEPPAEDADTALKEGLLKTCLYLKLSKEVKEIAVASLSADSFLASLVDAELLVPAIRWRAHELEKTEAVRWGCDCAEEVLPAGVLEEHRAGIEAAKAWADDPTEERRRAAEAEAERLDYEGVGGMLAAAAFWSGGSLAPDTVDAVPPDERLTGQAITAALQMAAVEADPAQAPTAYRRFLDKSQVEPSE
jgi:hypothetical protein